VGPRAGLAGAENLATTGIRSPDRPARSESLHQLRYPGPHKRIVFILYVVAVVCYTDEVWDSSVVYVLDDQDNGASSREEK